MIRIVTRKSPMSRFKQDLTPYMHIQIITIL